MVLAVFLRGAPSGEYTNLYIWGAIGAMNWRFRLVSGGGIVEFYLIARKVKIKQFYIYNFINCQL
jgi:hypothetical protein